MFKEGMKVRCVNGEGWGDNPQGKIFTVVDQPAPWACIRRQGQVTLNVVQNWSEDFELAEDKTSHAPKVPAYAVFKDGEVVFLSSSRELARDIKADFGGKAAGAVIYKLRVEKEIR